MLDRTGVIVEIFHRHAHSREAKLQVEIARLKYVSPRLRESSAGGGRQQGSGAGEFDLELDRRKIRDRLAELKEQLEDIQRDRPASVSASRISSGSRWSGIPMRRTTESTVLWSETCALGEKIAGARPHQLDAGPSGYRPLRSEGFPAAGQAAG